MIDVNCPQCRTVYHSREADVGKHILCTKCGSVVSIVLPADCAVIQQPPARATARGQGNQRATKHRRIYALAIAVVALVVTITLIMRHSSESPQASQPVKSGEYQVVGEEDAPTPNKQPSSEEPKPDPRPSEYNSLPTGARIEGDIGTDGHGKLAVENGTDEDAVVQLSDVTTDQTVRWFFVKAHTTAHKTRIPEGTYRLTFTTGLNWIETDDTFSWQPSYFEFEKTFDYKEQRDSEGVQFKEISVTLNPVLFGNVQTKTITREEFLKGHRHVALQQ